MIKLGLVGCGAIGTEIAKWIDANNNFFLTTVYDIDSKKAEELAGKLNKKPEILAIEKLIEKSDLIIEAAHKNCVKDLAEKAISRKKDIMLMSVSGLLGNEYLFALAEKNKTKIYVPSGAICGIDGIKAAGIGNIKSITLTTTKHPKALEGAPYILENKIELGKIKEKKKIFSGNALEAAKGFPQNINVCAVLSIAGIGPEKTMVNIIADPNADKNIHEISAEGDFGKLTTKTENIPSPRNPKTSYLAVLSAIAVLKQISNSIKIGN